MKFVLTGGGTGGHIYPALSVAAALNGEELLFVGAAERLESRVAPEAGYEFRAIACAPVERRPGLAMLRGLMINLRGVRQAVGILRDFRPNAVLGTGGFAASGVMAAAALLRIPLVIVEANSVPGRANRLLGRWAARIALGFETDSPVFPAARVEVTGVPIRPEIAHGKAHIARREYELGDDRRTLLILGGSGGARKLNETVLAALPDLLQTDVQILHQTGVAHWEESRAGAGDLPADYHPVAYIENMADALAVADLVVCRGGASTLAEITAAGKPAVVIPYPFAVGDHQTRNAAVLAKVGAVEIVPDGELDPERLVSAVAGWLGDPERLANAAEASRSMGRPDAAQTVARLLREAGKG